MESKEVIELINKYYDERKCMNCAIWDIAAQEHEKRGMCEVCFDMHYVLLEFNIERLGVPLLIGTPSLPKEQ